MIKHVRVPASKSDAHRAIICAALSDTPCEPVIKETSDDIEATKNCVAAIMRGESEVDVGESGSTLRFIVPLAAALGVPVRVKMHGRLPKRPMEPLISRLAEHGVTVKTEGDVLEISGELTPGDFTLPGDVSSQFASGLLMALPLLDDGSRVRITGKIESKGYVDMTVSTMEKFGVFVNIEMSGDTAVYSVSGGSRYRAPSSYTVEGDWSAAANWIAAGVIGSSDSFEVSGLNFKSAQGDKELVNILMRMKADIEVLPGDSFSGGREASVIARPSRGRLHGTSVDASQIPDIIPIIALIATHSRGESVIYNAGRLRLKESDRISSTVELLSALGASIIELEDGMIIKGLDRSSPDKLLHGGTVSSEGDHRIAMMAAVASTVADGYVVFDDYSCVSKSYPSFRDVFNSLGLDDNIINVEYSAAGEKR